MLTADLLVNKKDSITFNCSVESRDKKEVDNIIKQGDQGNWEIVSVKETEAKRTSRAPFTTSTLQQTASSRFGYTPSRTMRTAQNYTKLDISHISVLIVQILALSLLKY